MTEQPMDATAMEPAAATAGVTPDDGAIEGAPAEAAVTEAATAAPALEGSASGATTEPTPPEVDGADASLLSLIDRLSALLDRSELTELEVQVGSTGLVLRKPSAISPQVAGSGAPAAVPADGAAPSTGAAAPPAGVTPDGPPARPAVMAPLSGIWYGSPAPGSAPYVSVGGEVAVGQVIGLIEAMKLFNEIKSDKAGRVVKINAENGKLVRAKHPLIEVEPL
jgi:acetyl-CoA carboxylase biotin carboxyl carrier protein